MLFWTVVHVQSEALWALADTGSCRNLMSEAFWKSLHLNVPFSPPGLTRVLAGDGLPVDLRGWAQVVFTIGGHTVCHEVSIVRGLPLDFLVGGEFMAPHRCLLGYGDRGQHSLKLRQKICEKCNYNFRILKQLHDPQVKGHSSLKSSVNLCAASTIEAKPTVIPIQIATLDAVTERRLGSRKC